MIHRIWVSDGDDVVLVTNPPPSVADPARQGATVMTSYRVVDEGSLGASLSQSRRQPAVLADEFKNETELQRGKLKSWQR